VELIPHEGGLLTGNSPYRQYEIVGTSFWNEILPLVRYRTGDLIRVPAAWGSAELEELALGIRTFEGVLGRQQEIIVCPQPVRLSGVGCIPRAVDNVIRLQLVQERLDAVRVLVLPTPEFAANDASNLLANVRARVPDDVDVTVEIVSRLERTPRGKTPLIVHRPAVHDALRSNGLEPLFTR
jgi:phenylacetate-CoA ligase